MKIGEKWIYAGKVEPSEYDNKRWFEDEDGGAWYMNEVVITHIRPHPNYGEFVEFKALEGESHPMEAIWGMPRKLFVKEYRRAYEEG